MTPTLPLSDHLHARVYTALPPGPAFATIEAFVDAVGKLIRLDESVDGEQAGVRLHRAASLADPAGPIVSQVLARWRLIAHDLRRLADTPTPPAALVPVEEALADALAPITARLTDLGLFPEAAPLRVVDELPGPYAPMAWAAVVPDFVDRERSGIEPGMYFRRDKLKPFYSQALLAHELAHTVTSQVDPEIFAMGLEEGLCEILGTMHAARAILPVGVIRAILHHHRHGHGRPTLWTAYLAHTRQALLILQRHGLTGAAALLARGRAAIHQAEAAIIAGRHRTFDLPHGGFDPVTIVLAEQACLGYLPTHAHPPLQVLLLRHVHMGATVTDICRAADIPPAVGEPILRALGPTSGLFILEGQRVSDSNVEHYQAIDRRTPQPVIRYHPQETP